MADGRPPLVKFLSTVDVREIGGGDMGLAFQMYALDPLEMTSVLANPDAVADYFTERYITDVPGEAAWLDKAGMGILEALGVTDRRALQRLRAWRSLPAGIAVVASPCRRR